MAKIKNIENINDLEFKLGERYSSKHINIKNDRMYVSKEFAKYLINKPFKEHKKHSSNMYHTKYGTQFKGFYTTVVIRDVKFADGIRYLVAGSSGSHGFGGMQHTQAETLGVRVRREINKVLVDVFLSSPLIRLEKIRMLMNVKK